MSGMEAGKLWSKFRRAKQQRKIQKMERKRRRIMATFENYNGETKTRAGEGAIIGAIAGLVMGVVFCVMIYRSYMTTGAYMLFLFALTLFGSIAAFTFAGMLVGIGVPRFNPNPTQGWLNRWRQVMRNNRAYARRTDIGHAASRIVRKPKPLA